MERVENLIRFAMAPGIGPVTVHRLLKHFGDTDRILGASHHELLQVEGVREAQARAVAAAAKADPRPELELAEKMGVSLLGFDDRGYPESLRATYDPPLLLYVRGSIEPCDSMALAVVGTRRASLYGREQAERFGGLLGRAGITVVSGLARGVDSFAHQGALGSGGRTIAVIGSGLARIYPEENRDLAAEISTRGAVVSEFSMDARPSRESFPRRNRIIAGLSLGVLVVEAPERSGALITATCALEMGREVFAIPGRIDQENARGSNRLIREGATMVSSLDDVLSGLGPLADGLAAAAGQPLGGLVSAPPEPPAPDLPGGEAESKVLAALSAEPVHIDQICAATGLAIAKVSATLMILELKRAVVQKPGKWFVKTRP